MSASGAIAMKDDVRFSSFIRSLKCGICWDFLNKPHTLKCGHNYCMKCLTHLAKLTRDQRRRISFYPVKVKLPCPSCRYQHNVNTFLKKRASVNYVLQEVVNFWNRKRNLVRRNVMKEIRSIASQYECESEITRTEGMGCGTGVEEGVSQDISATELHYILPRIESEFFQLDNGCDQVEDDVTSGSNSSNVSSDSSSEESDDHTSQTAIRRIDRNRNIRVARDGFWSLHHEVYNVLRQILRFPNRTIMSLIWVGYTFSIMMIANSFFPYMMLYSLLFLLIMYVETLHGRLIPDD